MFLLTVAAILAIATIACLFVKPGRQPHDDSIERAENEGMPPIDLGRWSDIYRVKE